MPQTAASPLDNRLATVLLFLLLAAPAFLFVWNNQDSPLFGYHHDDGLYYVTSKSIHDGAGYRIASLPGQPFQTKYPPALPAYLALAWAIRPEFPANLAVASWLQFAWFPALLGLSLWLWRDLGFTGWKRWLLGAVLATNAYVLYFSVTLMSELPFTCLVLLCLMLLRKADDCAAATASKWILAAGLAGALAFLMRTAGVVLLVSVPAVLVWRNRRRDAMLFAAAMLPAVIGWFVWARAHQSPGTDPTTLYYTNYLGYHMSVFKLSEAHLFLWRNIDGFFVGVGGLILPSVFGSQILRITTQVLGVAAITGIVRMARQGLGLQYALFALLSSALLVIWSFPPNERFVLPMAPLIWAGLLFEFSRLANAIRGKLRDKDTGQRVAAGLILAVGAGLLLFAAKAQLDLRFGMFPGLADSQRQRFKKDLPFYEWARSNLPADAKIQTGFDTVTHLNTGRAAASMISPVGYFYRDDEDGRIEFLSKAGAYARDNGLQFVYQSSHDYRNDMDDDRRRQLAAKIAESPDLEVVQQFPGGVLYRVKPAVAR